MKQFLGFEDPQNTLLIFITWTAEPDSILKKISRFCVRISDSGV